MTDRGLRTGLAAIASMVMLVAACGTPVPSPSPIASPSVAPTAVPSLSPTAPPTPAPTATPSQTPAPSATPAEACAVTRQSGRLQSDRLVDVRISTGEDADFVTFVFGEKSLPDPPQGPSDGSLEAVEPPYTHASSGLPIELRGEHVVHVRFSGMSIMNDIGEPTYDRRLEFRPDLPALKDVVNMDMFEGVVGWYIAYDGPGCVSLRSDGRDVTVAIEH